MPNKSKTSLPNLHKSKNLLIIAGVVLSIGLILLLKFQPFGSASPEATEQLEAQKTEVTTTPTVGLSYNGTPEEQVDHYLEVGQAVFVFFHSDNCQSCIDMMGIVDEIYPEFQEVLPIVDVNVYDPLNQNLLRWAGVTGIPTQLFLAADGSGKIAVGVMNPDQLREQLSLLAGED